MILSNTVNSFLATTTRRWPFFCAKVLEKKFFLCHVIVLSDMLYMCCCLIALEDIKLLSVLEFWETDTDFFFFNWRKFELVMWSVDLYNLTDRGFLSLGRTLTYLNFLLYTLRPELLHFMCYILCKEVVTIRVREVVTFCVKSCHILRQWHILRYLLLGVTGFSFNKVCVQERHGRTRRMHIGSWQMFFKRFRHKFEEAIETDLFV